MSSEKITEKKKTKKDRKIGRSEMVSENVESARDTLVNKASATGSKAPPPNYYRRHSDSAKKMTSPSTLLSPATPSPGDAALVPTTTAVDVGVAAAEVALAASEGDDEDEEIESAEASPAPVTSVTVQLAVLVVLQNGEGGTSSAAVVVVLAQLEVAAATSTSPLPALASGACCAHDRPVALARTVVMRVEEARMVTRRECVIIRWVFFAFPFGFNTRLGRAGRQEGLPILDGASSTTVLAGGCARFVVVQRSRLSEHTMPGGMGPGGSGRRRYVSDEGEPAERASGRDLR